MKYLLERLLDLLKESVITQSMLVLLIFGPIAYLVITGNPIPLQLNTWGSVVIGFFFGAKSAYQIMKGR